MIEILNIILGTIIFLGVGGFAIGSTILVAERKARYRAGTHDYYDNEIK